VSEDDKGKEEEEKKKKEQEQEQDAQMTVGLELLVAGVDPQTMGHIRELANRHGHRLSVLHDPISLLSQLPLKPYDALIMVSPPPLPSPLASNEVLGAPQGTAATQLPVVEITRAIRSREIPSLYRMPIVVFSSRPSHQEKFSCHAAGV